MNTQRVAIVIFGVFLLFLSVRVGIYAYFSEYQKDARGNPIPPLLLIAGILTLRLAVVASSEELSFRVTRALRFGMYGGASFVLIALCAVVLFTLPPQGGLWLVFGGPVGYFLGAIVGLLVPHAEGA